MNLGEVAQFITSIATLVAAIATLRGIKSVVKHTNSMKDELVAEVRTASFNAGVKAEKENPAPSVSPNKKPE